MKLTQFIWQIEMNQELLPVIRTFNAFYRPLNSVGRGQLLQPTA